MRKTKTDFAYEQLKALIAEERIAKGRIIAIGEIASMLDLGRAPVLSAIKKLESEGFLDVVPQVGVIIRNVTLVEVRNIIDVRIAIECAIIKEVTPHIVPAELKEARASAREQEAAANARDFQRFLLADSFFHRWLYQKSRNPEMVEIMRRLNDRHFNTSLCLIMYPGRMETTVVEHDAIIDALALGDADAAQAAMRLHLENGKNLTL